MRQQIADRTGLVSWKSCQHVLEVSIGIVTIELGRLDQAHDRRGSLARHQRFREQPVLPARRPRADLLLVQVVVDRQCGVAQVARECAPAVQAVVDRLGRARAGWNPASLRYEPVVQRLGDRRGARSSLVQRCCASSALASCSMPYSSAPIRANSGAVLLGRRPMNPSLPM